MNWSYLFALIPFVWGAFFFWALRVERKRLHEEQMAAIRARIERAFKDADILAAGLAAGMLSIGTAARNASFSMEKFQCAQRAALEAMVAAGVAQEAFIE